MIDEEVDIFIVVTQMAEALKQLAGWFIVAILILTFILMSFRKRRTKVQQVTYELIIAFNLIIARSIYRTYTRSINGFPEPLDTAMWLAVMVFLWRFFWFAILMLWAYPKAKGYFQYARLWIRYQRERQALRRR